jgi:hypothetical protein
MWVPKIEPALVCGTGLRHADEFGVRESEIAPQALEADDETQRPTMSFGNLLGGRLDTVTTRLGFVARITFAG